MQKTVLVTGGAGYIGSHACVELLESGYQVVVVDNLANSKQDSLNRVETITGLKPVFYHADVRDSQVLRQIFENHKIDAVIHFAGLKAVGESCQQPTEYYQNNLDSTLILTQAMTEFGVDKLVFSSSATVYGDPHKVPITEDFPLTATNPYGRTKLFIEEILRDIVAADRLNKVENPKKVVLLRYFNPVGAHHSGLIGEDPNGLPNNLMPYLSQVAIGKLEVLSVFGNDYPTHDGTGVRDYIHVVDLAKGHVKAVDFLLTQSTDEAYCEPINLGTGNGYSVLDMINSFTEVNQQAVNYTITARRPGDVAECYADPDKAEQLLGWKAEKSLHDMMADTWRWQKNNPQGYA